MLGMVSCECMIFEASSLKEKRAVVQRIIKRLQNKFNVSVAEIGFQDAWQRTEIGIACLASSRAIAEKELNQALKLIDSFPEIERTITTFDWF
ncbi:MAG: DUF503 domain-containing protein [Bacillaceae bacterium]|jgi:uncharacterized protein|uniref:DUF503 domain-containing protein n=2 Tax=Aeribacillus TaxID=1055323 RepID=A0A165YZQ0_9BACI|nr:MULTISPECIES: DUF503 family protein [Aeribacillus]AXI39800.1 DUF503 domain-containing protein [Bacillaceae bacterium ZC4]REJ19543.1 MAG: DUF503 domain-containing protein [Bacillaceae bacterium]ASS91518.1 hypothetical protein AP3564_15990 [Aeribacillus pallidus]KZM57936.1 hypothetical protein A3Q35_00235 [Aeribacillus pallidus]KZN97639.1 hypothetical protein AZI98_02420 [Aeribacillus pallidus]